MSTPLAHIDRILLVDDDASILDAVTDLLQANGYHVTPALDGQQALASIPDAQPDLIISDISMPNMDGLQLFRSVRQNPAWAGIPFVFLTARGQQADVRHGYTLGVDDYIVKPFEPEDLIVKIKTRLARARQIQAAAAQEADRIKDQLIKVFSHELRTPLTYIYGYASLLSEDRASLDRSTIDHMLGGMVMGAERLVRLVEDLMMIVRIDNAVLAVEIERRSEPLDLAAVARHAVAALKPTADACGVELAINVHDGLRTRGVGQYLENAVIRLIDNAIRFAKPEHGNVAVFGEIADSAVRLTVSDDGIGIAPADQAQIFERFTQINRDANEQQGLGLGLSVARSIIETHQGTITVDSRLGEGSKFTVTLPRSRP